MREISQDFKDHLGGHATTLCWLWKLIREDDVSLGFTNHDRPLKLNGLTYESEQSLIPSETDSRLGYSADNSAVSGVLDSALITSKDILAGLYENAVIETYRANWQDPEQHVHMSTGRLGKIRQRGDIFEAELTGQSVLLSRSVGRVFSRLCDAEFGDSRCGLNPDDYPQGTICPRSFQACQTQFNNVLNFRGFPYLLGDDALQAGPQIGERRDGSSRFS